MVIMVVCGGVLVWLLDGIVYLMIVVMVGVSIVFVVVVVGFCECGVVGEVCIVVCNCVVVEC